MDNDVYKKVAATHCRHANQTIKDYHLLYDLLDVLCCIWSTSHVTGRFPDLQLNAYFTFSHIWVMQWFMKFAPCIQ